jgi:hypothetical protein
MTKPLNYKLPTFGHVFSTIIKSWCQLLSISKTMDPSSHLFSIGRFYRENSNSERWGYLTYPSVTLGVTAGMYLCMVDCMRVLWWGSLGPERRGNETACTFWLRRSLRQQQQVENTHTGLPARTAAYLILCPWGDIVDHIAINWSGRRVRILAPCSIEPGSSTVIW